MKEVGCTRESRLNALKPSDIKNLQLAKFPS